MSAELQRYAMGDNYAFASDNVAGVCPEAQDALLAALAHSMPSYGADAITAAAVTALQELFETACRVYFVFTGTAANALALRALCAPHTTVIAHQMAHVETDECNAPEYFNPGMKVRVVGGPRAKLDPVAVEQQLARPADVHFSPVGALSLTQTTELGGLYTPDEIAHLADLAHRAGARVHLDGARFANAVAELGVSPADLTWRAGVDLLCFGGTKQGMPGTEALVVFNPDVAPHLDYWRKQAGQLASKMRFLAAPWVGMLAEGAWLRHAAHANACAQALAHGLAALPGVEVLTPVHGNAVFVALPPGTAEAMHARGWHFYLFTPTHHRLMCSWATTQTEIDALVADLAQVLAARSTSAGAAP